jgi:hypothetical protein
MVITPVVPAPGEAEQGDGLSPGVQGQSGQHSRIPALKKKKKKKKTPCVSVTRIGN